MYRRSPDIALLACSLLAGSLAFTAPATWPMHGQALPMRDATGVHRPRPSRDTIVTAEYELIAPSREIAQAKRALDLAAAQFLRHIGVPAPRITVVLLDGQEPPPARTDSRMLLWFTSAGLSAARTHSEGNAVPTDTARDRAFAESALPHEACHWWLSEHLTRVRGAERGSAGGQRHGNAEQLPAWLNEGFATLCEPSDWRAVRLKTAAANADSLIPLASFFSMAHPMGVSTLPIGTDPSSSTRAQMMRNNATPRSRLFYAQSAAFVHFVAERGSPEAIGRIASVLVGGGYDAARVSAVLAEGRRFPADISALEVEWRAWLRKRS